MNRLNQLHVYLLTIMPGYLGILARSKYYHKHVGNHVLIRRGVTITHPEKLRIGVNCSINQDTIIRARYGVTIGDYTMISWRCNILTQNHSHDLNGVPYRYQGYTGAKITIGKNCWIGCNTTILPEVTIGDNCIIGASSVVTKDVPANSVIVGVNRLINGGSER